jgi:DNA repair exonuclease SbcCD ATPase subunit
MEKSVAEIKKESAPAREIGVITAEIKDLCRQAQTMALLYAVEIGRRLEEAKRALPYGKWGEWLKNEVEFSQSSANNFMKLYEEYGAAQISIFGASVDSQTFANLPYSKALQLLAVPKDEREAFAEEVGAADLSVKELKAAIEERDRAKKEAEDAKAREEELADKLAEAEAAAVQSSIKAEEATALHKKLEEMTGELERAKENASTLREQLKKAEKDPKIPKAKLDQIRKEAAEAARKEAEAASSKVLAEAKSKAEAAEADAIAAKLAAKQAQERLEEAQKKLKTASPEVTAFKALFDSMQGTAAKLRTMIEKVREDDPETADKLSAALKAFGSSL